MLTTTIMRQLIRVTFAASLLWCGVAWSASLTLESGNMLKLSPGVTQLQYSELHLHANSLLLIPASVECVSVTLWQLGADAKVVLLPRSTPIEWQVDRAILAAGSALVGRGAEGETGEPGTAGADIVLTINEWQIDDFAIDVRGGNGGNGWAGIDGVPGEDASCVWLSDASAGLDGGDGGMGGNGGRGGHVILNVPPATSLQMVDFRLSGGAAGNGGAAGLGGLGGKAANCAVYDYAAAAHGKPGRRGASGESGAVGRVTVGHLAAKAKESSSQGNNQRNINDVEHLSAQQQSQ